MTEITFGTTQKGKQKLIDTVGYAYVLAGESKFKDVKYWHCSIKRCRGRFKYNIKTGEGVISAEHNSKIEHSVGPIWRAKDAALAKLKELTLSVEGSVKAIELVRSVLKELSPEVRSIMPREDNLTQRVMRWAKSSNIELVKATRQDYLIPEDEHLPDGTTGGLASTNEVVACTDSRETNASEFWGRRERHKRSRIKSLKRVDEDGNEIGFASLEDFLRGPCTRGQDSFTAATTGGSTTSQQHKKSYSLEPVPSANENIPVNDDMGEEEDCMEYGGDDFQMDFEPEPEPISPQTPVVMKKQSSTVITSSNPPMTAKLPLTKDAVKSGERCFVCGDELIVSETLSASEDTFRTACRYLNVRSNGEWFPRTKNAKFYSFCESCTNEIHRIHSLYRKIEEIQSLIFKKVESVEKRIADAEIVDNWMAEAPHSTAVRFEGFRNQVMINYRNKLKLRREIRFGKKTGQPLVEVQPTSSVHMFAKDPFESRTFLATVPDDGIIEHSENHTATAPESASPARRTRGRPKSKKPVHEQETVIPAATNEEQELDDDTNNINDNDDDGCFDHDFDDSQDAMSETSEKEVKFWEDDPSKLEFKRQSKSQAAEDEDNDESDPTDDEEDDDDDWAPAIEKRSSKMLKSLKRDTAADGGAKIIFGIRKRREEKVVKPKVEKFKSAQTRKFKFPDAVLTKDGRVFMEGIEIIKNPPGVYKPRPYSVSFTCGGCGKIVLGFWDIRLHISGHHLGLFKCHICQKELADPKSLAKHIKMIHEESSSYENCPICGKPIRNYNHCSMVYHRWIHLSKEEKEDPQYKSWRPTRDKDPSEMDVHRQTFMCGQCGKTFKLPSLLKKHELKHGESLPKAQFICQYCGKSYSDRKGLSRHVIRCESNTQGKVNLTFPCPKCKTRLSSRETRAKHIKKFHTNTLTSAELPFSCTKCPRRFSTRIGFRTHKRVCVDGKQGYNTKKRTDQEDPPESAANTSTNLNYTTDFKPDPSAASFSSPPELNQSQSHYSLGPGPIPYYSTDASAALGFNYKFT